MPAGTMNLPIASIRHAARQFRASRMFTTAAVLTLALGIGGTTAIVTLMDAVMLRSLPVSDPARLYRIGDGDDSNANGRHGRWGLFSFPLYARLKAATPEFQDLTAFDWGGSLLSVRRQGAEDAARPLRAEYVTGTYFATLGVSALRGRVFAPDDDRPSAPPVVVLSHHAWQGDYGGDLSVVGTTFVVEGHPFTVIGVAAPGFFGETIRADPPDMWIPLQQEPVIAGGGSLLHQSVSPWLFMIGRLRRDASIDGMAPRLTEILRHWIQYEADYPSNWMPDIIRDLPKQTVAVVAAGAGIGLGGLSAKEQYGPSLQILLALCGLVLLMACANVANLLLARAVARRAQTAVRLAIGATRRQIVVEALAESVLLALAGAVAGLLVATSAARLLVALAFRNSRFVPVTTSPSLVVLAFAAGLALVTGVVFGAAPAWLATRTDPIDALRGSHRPTGDHSSGARTALLIIQAMLSVVLIAGATMLARSLENLEHQNMGYRVQGRVLIGLNRLPPSYTPQQLSTLYRDLEQRLASLPGVGGYGLALYNLPGGNWNETIVVAGHPPKAINESGASWDRVSVEYLQNLGVTMLRGRLFTAADTATTAPVAVVNEAFAKRFFKANEDPLDQHFGVERPEDAGTFRIVGIVRDAKFALSDLSRPARPMFFVPLAQRVDYNTDYRRMIEVLSHVIRGILLVTEAPVGELEPQLRRTLADADPNLTITSVRTLQQQIDLSLDRKRGVARLAELFGMVALVLAAVGVYGVTAYMVAQQTNEIGIRIALGADRATVLQWVLRRALQRVAMGLAVGLPLAVGAARFMAAQLYGVSFWDPFALTVAAGSTAGCAFVAAIIPAGRAATISPMSALRAE
jgi:predicted permease